MYYKRVDGSLG